MLRTNPPHPKKCRRTTLWNADLLRVKLQPRVSVSPELPLPTRSSATVEDRATCCVSRNLVNCCTTVGTICTTNPQQIEVMELEYYSRRMCSKQPWRVDRRRYCQPSTSSIVDKFADNAVDLIALAKISESRVWNKVPERSAHLFWRYPNFLTTQRRIGGTKPPC